MATKFISRTEKWEDLYNPGYAVHSVQVYGYGMTDDMSSRVLLTARATRDQK